METNTVETIPTATAAPVVEPEKTKRIPKAAVTTSGNVLTFTFGNGAAIVADYDKLTEALKLRSGLHGLEQKLRDTYAGAKTPDEAQGMCQKAMDHLFAAVDPSWTAGREGNGPSEDSIDLLARALINVAAAQGQTKDFDSVKAKMTAADKETRAAYRGIPEVGIELAKLKAAKSTPKLTLSALDGI